MIVSVSRRTDVPAFLFDWFLALLTEGSVKVANPYNPKQVKTVPLTRETVDAFVFWTKDPSSLLRHNPLLDSFPWIALVTLTSYGKEWEPAFPDKVRMIEQVQRLADKIGRMRVVWRYDPIILTKEHSIDWHASFFTRMARKLSGYTDRCIVSFVTPYRKNRSFLENIGWVEPSPMEKGSLLEGLRGIAASEKIELSACADPHSKLPGACIDGAYISTITERTTNHSKDPHQRPACLCIQSIDIGTYGTCRGGCGYCYAA